MNAPVQANGRSGRTVLIIDDAITIRAYLERLLVGAGYEVLTAMNGTEGVGLAMSEVPDAILCDVNMPQMNGYEATRRLRLSPDTRAIPIAILTTEGKDSDIDQALQAGANFHMVKPPKPELVLSVVSFLTGWENAA